MVEDTPYDREDVGLNLAGCLAYIFSSLSYQLCILREVQQFWDSYKICLAVQLEAIQVLNSWIEQKTSNAIDVYGFWNPPTRVLAQLVYNKAY